MGGLVQTMVAGKELALWEKTASSTAGAVVTSLVVTPLDMVKTRIQVQSAALAATPDVGKRFAASRALIPGTLEWHQFMCQFPKCQWAGRFTACVCDMQGVSPRFQGTWDALQKISKLEGRRALWSGLRPTLVLQIPSTVMYLGAYEKLLHWMRHELDPAAVPFAPALAGMSARVLAASAVAPLELVRTRRQATKRWPHKSVMGAIRAIVATEGPGTLFRGLAPTLARDVPFSGVYWLGVERVTVALRRSPPSRWLGYQGEYTQLVDSWCIGVAAGFTAGSFAAILTTPFDVVKTRQQTSDTPTAKPSQTATVAHNQSTSRLRCLVRGIRPSIWRVAEQIVAREGLSGLFVGVTARVGKVGPACAIMISTFELSKTLFAS